MNDYGSDGIYITPRRVGEDGWELSIKALIDNADCSHKARFTLIDADGNEKASTIADLRPIISAKLPVEDPVLWNGRKNPYLYTVRCEIFDSTTQEVTDNIDIRTGLREYHIDSHKGFFLNGEHIKLQGVSRHQDRENMGNAITEKQHAEDVKIILDVGANSVRLAHYQQNSYFYDLCDESGLLVWAEVPVISRFSPKRNENAEQQLVELIKQNYNHPSIFCWGIENEITIAGSASKKLITFLKHMHKVARHLDPTRYTTCAQLTMCPVNSPLNHITDIIGYNHYYGWYMGSCDEINNWLDEWHRENPEGKLCLSEYGAEGITKYHSDSPVQGDYSEDYQAIYHEHYIKSINERDWLWGSYVWNMFDFGSASRNEGGVRGRNNKGLVTFNRKTKKDAFWLYKAYWSDKKFVHITGERYVNRPAGKSTIKVYSNCPEITLEVNGKTYTKKADRVFVFDDVELKLGENVIKARGGKVRPSHTITVNGIEKATDEYKMPAEYSSFVRNWFVAADSEGDPNKLSVEDSMGEVLSNGEVNKIIKNAAGDFAAKAVSSPLLKPIYPVKVKTMIKLAGKLGVDEKMLSLAGGFLQTIDKN